MLLYFGARYEKTEYLYGEEIESYKEDGILTELRKAFSRDQEHKIYAQHRIEQVCISITCCMYVEVSAVSLVNFAASSPDSRWYWNSASLQGTSIMYVCSYAMCIHNNALCCSR